MKIKGYVISERRVNQVLLKYRDLKARKDAIGKKLSHAEGRELANLMALYSELFEEIMLLLDVLELLGLSFDLNKEIYTDLPAEHEVFGVRTVEILREV